jgi:hypothetical protein
LAYTPNGLFLPRLPCGQDPEAGGEERDHGTHLPLDRELGPLAHCAGRNGVVAPQRGPGCLRRGDRLVFNFAGSNDAKESQKEIQEAISRFFDLPVFVLLGMALPWEEWLKLGWIGLLLVAAVLLLRRLPAGSP